MKNVAVIPARAGSKSIRNKNLVTLDGKCLIDIAMDQALRSGIFDSVIVSTDIECILKSPRDGVTYRERPEHLASDTALMVDVLLDVVSNCSMSQDSYLWLLQPTSPFRSKDDFSNINAALKSQGPPSLISVSSVGATHPSRTYHIQEGKLKHFHVSNFKNKQELRPVVIRNGCFYVVKLMDFLEQKSFYINECKPYEMDDLHSINIDGPLDLILARAVCHGAFDHQKMRVYASN